MGFRRRFYRRLAKLVGDDPDLTERHRLAMATTEDRLANAIAFLQNPADPDAAKRLSGTLRDLEVPLSDDLHEALLRTLLKHEPYRFDLTKSLISLLLKTGRAPFPIEDVLGEGPFSLDELLEQFEAVDERNFIDVLATFWQMVVQHPESALGWAELARILAARFDWFNARIAAARGMAKNANYDSRSAAAIVAALSVMAEQSQLADLDWIDWFFALPREMQSTPEAACLLVHTARPEAIERVSQMRMTTPDDAGASLVAALAAHGQEDWAEAYKSLHRAFELDLPGTLRRVIMTCSAQAAQIIAATRSIDAIETWLTEHSVGDVNFTLIPSTFAPDAITTAQLVRQRALDRGLASPILIAQGKSGSASVANILNSGFKLPTAVYSLISLRVIGPWLADYLRGGVSYTTHLDPSDRNIALLAAGGVKNVIVHVRDPRQVLVSLMEHYRRYPAHRSGAFGRNSLDDDAALRAVFEEQMPVIVGWIDGWVRARDKLATGFTTFEEFVSDRERFVDRILSLYGGDTRYFDRASALGQHSAIDYHRRKGSIDEWRTRLSAKQIDLFNAAIPERYWDLFGWSP